MVTVYNDLAPRIMKLDEQMKLLPPYAYKGRDRLKSDVVFLFQNQKTLVPEVKTFKHGTQRVQLFFLYGVLPINWKGNEYNIPVTMYFDPPYPDTSPRCFVTPAKGMSIPPNHPNVDQTGMCYCGYLSSWNPGRSNLVDLVQELVRHFAALPPVFYFSGKNQGQRPQQQVGPEGKGAQKGGGGKGGGGGASQGGRGGGGGGGGGRGHGGHGGHGQGGHGQGGHGHGGHGQGGGDAGKGGGKLGPTQPGGGLGVAGGGGAAPQMAGGFGAGGQMNFSQYGQPNGASASGRPGAGGPGGPPLGSVANMQMDNNMNPDVAAAVASARPTQGAAAASAFRKTKTKHRDVSALMQDPQQQEIQAMLKARWTGFWAPVAAENNKWVSVHHELTTAQTNVEQMLTHVKAENEKHQQQLRDLEHLNCTLLGKEAIDVDPIKLKSLLSPDAQQVLQQLSYEHSLIEWLGVLDDLVDSRKVDFDIYMEDIKTTANDLYMSQLLRKKSEAVIRNGAPFANVK